LSAIQGEIWQHVLFIYVIDIPSVIDATTVMASHFYHSDSSMWKWWWWWVTITMTHICRWITVTHHYNIDKSLW